MFHGGMDVSWRNGCFMEGWMFHGGMDVSWRDGCFMEGWMFHGGMDVSWRDGCFMEGWMFHGGMDVSWRDGCFMERWMFHGGMDVSWRNALRPTLHKVLNLRTSLKTTATSNTWSTNDKKMHGITASDCGSVLLVIMAMLMVMNWKDLMLHESC